MNDGGKNWVFSGSGWSSKDCAATERVGCLPKRLKALQNILLVLNKPYLKFQVSQTTLKPIPQPYKTIYLCAWSRTDS